MEQEDARMVKAIVGANWGDEGKGKITDTLAKESDMQETLPSDLRLILAVQVIPL